MSPSAARTDNTNVLNPSNSVRMSDATKIAILATMTVLLVILFVTIGASGIWEYVFPRRMTRVAAMILASVAVATSTIIFQTLTNNRILSPSIIGLDSLFLLIQTVIVYAFGSGHTLVRSSGANFFLSAGMMMLFAFVIYRMFFAGERQNVFLILLVGIIFGTFFSSISSFLQVLIDPNEFLIVQDRMFASFNNIQTNLLAISAAIMVPLTWWTARFIPVLNVLALGKDHAVNLGVDYARAVKQLLMIVFVYVSVSTALIGPVTFIGLIVVNVAYGLIHTFQRGTLMIASGLIAMIAIIGGQLIVERIFEFSAPLSVIINLIGGIYFIYLVITERST